MLGEPMYCFDFAGEWSITTPGGASTANVAGTLIAASSRQTPVRMSIPSFGRGKQYVSILAQHFLTSGLPISAKSGSFDRSPLDLMRMI